MTFDPSTAYGTVHTSSGKQYYVQAGVIYDTKTLAQVVTGLDEFPPSSNIPFFQRDLVAKGLPPGASPFYIIGRKTGVNNARLDMWEGSTALYVFPPAGGIRMQVVSASANDAAAGTGARKVHFHGLDANYNQFVETVTLNGTTPVLTTKTDILRVNFFHVETVGTGEVAAGNISLQNVGGTVTYSLISAGFNTARTGVYTVPAGYTAYLAQWAPSGGSAAAHFNQIDLQATSHLGVAYPGTFIVQDAVGNQNNGFDVTFSIPIKIPEKMDIKLTGVSDSGSAAATLKATVYGWLEVNT